MVQSLKKVSSFRNLLIIVSYPLRFTIYCGMSQQFRNVVHQMVAERTIFFKIPPKGSNEFAPAGGKKLIPQMADRRSNFLQKFIAWLPRKKRQSSGDGDKTSLSVMNGTMCVHQSNEETRKPSSQVSVSIAANGIIQHQKEMLENTSI